MGAVAVDPRVYICCKCGRGASGLYETDEGASLCVGCNDTYEAERTCPHSGFLKSECSCSWCVWAAQNFDDGDDDESDYG